MGTALVIENDPSDPLGRLADWFAEAELPLTVLRPHAGDELPADLGGHIALVVLGGDQSAYPGPAGEPGAPWFPALEGLLRKAVRNRVPTLGVCLGAQLLATAHGGLVERSTSGPEIGPALVGRRVEARVTDREVSCDCPYSETRPPASRTRRTRMTIAGRARIRATRPEMVPYPLW